MKALPSFALLGRSLLAGASLLLVPSATLACATVGASGPVPIRGEEALIVWDEDTHTEHFIRRALFAGAPSDFGFLVPTPDKPELADASASVFDRLFALYEMKHDRTGWNGTSKAGPMPSAVMAPVEVVAQQRVAGMDATILKATDVNALDVWLAAHKYPRGPALKSWLEPYVKRGSYVTAFKLAGGPRSDSGAVRMSFHTDVPTFPYSEPMGNHDRRPFRVSVIAKKRVLAKLGEKEWLGPTYAGPLGESESRALLDGVAPRSAQWAGWLTTFDEPGSIRGKEDLTFKHVFWSTKVASMITAKIEP